MEKRLIIINADAGVKPIAMMVKIPYTLIAISTVFAALVYIH